MWRQPDSGGGEAGGGGALVHDDERADDPEVKVGREVRVRQRGAGVEDAATTAERVMPGRPGVDAQAGDPHGQPRRPLSSSTEQQDRRLQAQIGRAHV